MVLFLPNWVINCALKYNKVTHFLLTVFFHHFHIDEQISENGY